MPVSSAGGARLVEEVACRETSAAAWIGLHTAAAKGYGSGDLFTDWLDLRDRAAATAARPGPLVADHPGYGPLSPWPTAGRPGPGLTTDRRGQSGSAASHLCRRARCGPVD
jgi:hypothetical protein